MSDLFLTHRIGKQRLICVSELSTDTLAEHGLSGPAYRSGLYFYTVDDRPRVGGISVLARVPTMDAAFEILDLFKTKARTKKATPKKKAVRRKHGTKSSRRSKPRKIASNNEARI